ncbi:MAG TPA: hypothetical protein DSN98_07745 [Thermoplasmata archaeon]|jgi:hypothetical protein|nr:MAG TPA: hypothetical protein DSN98_07745 [Thermoplasmata archaeon]
MKHLQLLTIVIAALLCITLVGNQAAATAPRYLKLTYQKQTNTLKVTILHFSPAMKIHYVYRVEIDKNGLVYQAHLYLRQPRIAFFSYTYNVTANPGDTLTISAYCILWGFIQKSITVV